MIKCAVKRLLVFLLVMIFVFSNVLVTPVMAATNLTDLGDSQYNYIVQKWLDNGYITGYEDGTFRPNDPITRAEFMRLVNKSMGLSSTGDASFLDVSKDNWFYYDVQTAYAYGYVIGSDKKIFPSHNICRQELAVILARLGYYETEQEFTSLSNLTDSDIIPDWAKPSVGATMQEGFFEGFVVDKFNPSEYVTRLEAVITLDRLIQDISATIEDEMIPETTVATTGGSSSHHHHSSGSSDVSVTGITVSSGNYNAYVGDTLQMVAVVTPSDATNKTLTWNVVSLVNGTATIDSNGLLKATGAGTVQVTATNTASGVSGTSPVITISAKSSEKAITGFCFKALSVDGGINEPEKKITVIAPMGTDASALVATFTNSALSTVYVGDAVQVSGTTANNFTSPVSYTVKAQDGTTAVYVVTVLVSTGDTKEIDAAILAAESVKVGIKVSTDGKDVLLTDKWVTQADEDALDSAISTALAAKKIVKNSEDVLAAVAALNSAVDTYRTAIKPGKMVDKSKLVSAINSGNTLKAIVTTKLDENLKDETALDGEYDKYQGKFNDFVEVLDDATTINNNAEATQAEVDEAVADLISVMGDLNIATSAFDTAVAKLAKARDDIATALDTAFTLHRVEDGMLDAVLPNEKAALGSAYTDYNNVVQVYRDEMGDIKREFTTSKTATEIYKLIDDLNVETKKLTDARVVYDAAVKLLNDTRDKLKAELEAASKLASEEKAKIDAIPTNDKKALAKLWIDYDAAIKGYKDIIDDINGINKDSKTVVELEDLLEDLKKATDDFNVVKIDFEAGIVKLEQARINLNSEINTAKGLIGSEKLRMSGVTPNDRTALDNACETYETAITAYEAVITEILEFVETMTASELDNARIVTLAGATITFNSAKNTFNSAESNLAKARGDLNTAINNADSLYAGQNTRLSLVTEEDKTALVDAWGIYNTAAGVYKTAIENAKTANTVTATTVDLNAALTALNGATANFNTAKDNFDLTEKTLLTKRTELQKAISDANVLLSEKRSRLASTDKKYKVALAGEWEVFNTAVDEFAGVIVTATGVSNTRASTVAQLNEQTTNLANATTNLNTKSNTFEEKIKELDDARKALKDAIAEATSINGTEAARVEDNKADETALAGKWGIYDTAVKVHAGAIFTATQASSYITFVSNAAQLNAARDALENENETLNTEKEKFIIAVNTLSTARANLNKAISNAAAFKAAQDAILTRYASDETALGNAWTDFENAISSYGVAITTATTENTMTATATELDTTRSNLSSATGILIKAINDFELAQARLKVARADLKDALLSAANLYNEQLVIVSGVPDDTRVALAGAWGTFNTAVASYETAIIDANNKNVGTTSAEDLKAALKDLDEATGIFESAMSDYADEVEKLAKALNELKSAITSANEEQEAAFAVLGRVSGKDKAALDGAWNNYFTQCEIYGGEILEAEKIRDNPKSTADELDAARAELATATTNFNKAKADYDKAVSDLEKARDDLEAVLSDAQDLYDIEDDRVSGISPEDQTALGTVFTTYEDAVEAYGIAVDGANAVFGSGTATTTELRDAILDLAGATTTFEGEKDTFDKAYEELTTARDYLEDKVEAAQQLYDDEYDRVDGLSANDITALGKTTMKKYNDALSAYLLEINKARAVSDDLTKSKKEIDKAESDLGKATTKFNKAKVDFDKAVKDLNDARAELDATIAEAEALESNTPEGWNSGEAPSDAHDFLIWKIGKAKKNKETASASELNGKNSELEGAINIFRNCIF